MKIIKNENMYGIWKLKWRKKWRHAENVKEQKESDGSQLRQIKRHARHVKKWRYVKHLKKWGARKARIKMKATKAHKKEKVHKAR